MSDSAVEDADLLDLANRIPSAVSGGSPDLASAQKEELEKRNQKIPGLDLTFGDAADLELSESDLDRIREAKKQYGDIHLVRTLKRPYLVRECKRLEWRNKILDIQSDLAKARKKMVEDGKDEGIIDQVLDMIMQERVVSWLLVSPQYEVHDLRVSLAPGEIDTLFKCTMFAQGYGQNVVPIKV